LCNEHVQTITVVIYYNRSYRKDNKMLKE